MLYSVLTKIYGGSCEKLHRKNISNQYREFVTNLRMSQESNLLGCFLKYKVVYERVVCYNIVIIKLKLAEKIKYELGKV